VCGSDRSAWGRPRGVFVWKTLSTEAVAPCHRVSTSNPGERQAGLDPVRPSWVQPCAAEMFVEPLCPLFGRRNVRLAYRGLRAIDRSAGGGAPRPGIPLCHVVNATFCSANVIFAHKLPEQIPMPRSSAIRPMEHALAAARLCGHLRGPAHFIPIPPLPYLYLRDCGDGASRVCWYGAPRCSDEPTAPMQNDMTIRSRAVQGRSRTMRTT
jgi:hypothetical protein